MERTPLIQSFQLTQDQDHINGLDVVLDKLDVRQLWIHKPWEHDRGLASKFADGRVTDFSLSERLRESLDSASDLVLKAQRKGIYIIETILRPLAIQRKRTSGSRPVSGLLRKPYS